MEQDIVDLNLIKKQFLCCTPIVKFQWNKFENRPAEFAKLSLGIQREILNVTVDNELVKNYPIKKSYQRAFLKLLINELETSSQEVHDDLYAAYCSMLSSDGGESENQYRHFLFETNPTTGHSITLEESVNFVSLGTTGLCTWQAGLRLAEWCLTNGDLLAGKRILELGCGVGLTGLAVVRTCAPREYIFSDSHPAVLAMLCKNIIANCPSGNHDRLSFGSIDSSAELRIDFDGVIVRAMRLPWEEINDDDDTEIANNRVPDPDVVLAADVLYDESCFESLASALRSLLGKKGAYAVLAYTVRNEDTVARFTRILGTCRLVFDQIALPEEKVFINADETPVRIMKIVSSEGLKIE